MRVPHHRNIRQKQWFKRRGRPVLVMIGVGLIGVVLLISSHADTPVVSKEAENGTRNGATSFSDPTASNGGAIRFGSADTSGTENPTPGAVSVMDSKYGLTGNDSQDPDDTTVFAAAMTDAVNRTGVRYANGPGGAPQAVVYVPPGHYRLSGLDFINNVRLEVDAGAVLEPFVQPANYNSSYSTNLMGMGGNDHTVQLKNVSLVGVGTSSSTSLKQEANPVASGWDLTKDFTVDMDADQNGGGPNDMSVATLINVSGFLIKNMYVINNNDLPSCSNFDDGCPVTRGGAYPPPTNSRANVVFRPSNESGAIPNGPYYQPTNGSMVNIYTIHSPYGFGPNQVTAGDHLTFQNLYSDGGTTLRMETDATKGKTFGGTVKTVTADNIVGVNCNRAVSMASHYQLNDDVHVTNVRSISCNDGVVMESENATSQPAGKGGNFTNSTITHMSVTAGTQAQLPVNNSNGRWVVGQSQKSVYIHPAGIDWSVNISDFSCSGSFADTSEPFTLDGVDNSRVNC